ncbi:S-layer homology domain-containing protein [Sporanaerobacter acetigenes]|uniref:S-layer homology domain-containing protein n=1 Tax=Sporanaerobacter acetigenes TaxID=165813 RepID=UPI001044A8C5|nr:S-layer homology domain-containing protein [Sporanaerobacter acetigenes]
MQKRRTKVLVVAFVSLIMLLNSVLAFAEPTDIEGHWAKEYILELVEKEIVKGYSDGTFRPENNITRAEFYKIVNYMMKIREEENVEFKDVSSKDWFYLEVKKGVKAGYIEKGEALKPNEPITREEVVKIIGIVFDIKNEDYKLNFKDYKEIDKSVEIYLKGMVEKGYISGYSDGTFRAKKNITRAEAAKIIMGVGNEILDVKGEYRKDIKGNLVVSSSDVVLKNMTVEGNLYIVCEGSFKASNLNVKGKVYIMGGEKGSISFEKSTMGSIVVRKDEVKVNLQKTKVLEAEILSQNVFINSDLKIEKVFSRGRMILNNMVFEKGERLDKYFEKKDNISGGGISTGGSENTGGENNPTPPTVEPKISAYFHKSQLENFGRVSIDLEGLEGAKKYSVNFKYSDGKKEDTLGPVNTAAKTTEIYYNGEHPVNITVYKDNGEVLHVFKNVYLNKK